MSMNALVELKNFLADRTELAILAISLLINAYLFLALQRAKADQIKSLETLLPLATRMNDLFIAAAAKAKARNHPPSFSSSDSGIR